MTYFLLNTAACFSLFLVCLVTHRVGVWAPKGWASHGLWEGQGRVLNVRASQECFSGPWSHCFCASAYIPVRHTFHLIFAQTVSSVWNTLHLDICTVNPLTFFQTMRAPPPIAVLSSHHFSHPDLQSPVGSTPMDFYLPGSAHYFHFPDSVPSIFENDLCIFSLT